MFITGFGDIGILILRVVLGWIFIYHGYYKLIDGKGIAKGMGNVKFGKPMFILGVLECLSGLAVMVGVWVQPATLMMMLAMLGAIFLVKIKIFKTPFSSSKTTGWEFDLINLAAAIALFFLGAGQYSVGALFNLPL